MTSKRVSYAENAVVVESTPLLATDDDAEEEGGTAMFRSLKDNDPRKAESLAADKLSMRLLQIDDDDSETEARILRESLDITLDDHPPLLMGPDDEDDGTDKAVMGRLCTMISMSTLAIGVIGALLYLGVEFVGPPNQPVGPYQLVERQEGGEFYNYYTFYEGPDSAGSNGYNNYVSEATGRALGIFNITYEEDYLDLFRVEDGRSEEPPSGEGEGGTNQKSQPGKTPKLEPFVYVSSSPTAAGPRQSIRLEGRQRFNRGLFIIDVRHMPAGCGVWPAFWLTDEANWPVNGEIDIVEGVNFQSVAKTALHSTRHCSMEDVPIGLKTGTWDTAVGIPDRDTGIPDMTVREATNCYVYDPHQWLNQGCVAVDDGTGGDSLGIPLNEKGGGIFALEWDPANRHIRTWVFTPHQEAPDNLIEAIRTAQEPVVENRVQPDPNLWPLPYGYFPIGDQTKCAASHFRNMRLVLNTAFCGSVSGNRFFVDCKNESKTFKSCNAYIKSNPAELDEAYWKIRGVYVYQRAWQKAWLGK